MNGNEIREKVDYITNKIKQSLTKFILTEEITNLLKEKEALQQICVHKFENGKCKYCDLKVDEDND